MKNKAKTKKNIRKTNTKISTAAKRRSRGSKADYDEANFDLALHVATDIASLRILGGITQSQLAERIGTLQPSVARMESGEYMQSLKTLNRIADALATELVPPKFQALEDYRMQKGFSSIAETSQVRFYIAPVIEGIENTTTLPCVQKRNKGSAEIFANFSMNESRL